MEFLVPKPSKLVCDELQVVSFHNAKASTSVRLSTVLVEIGKWMLVFGSRAQVSISSPAKSTGRRMIELKKLLRPPLLR
jgi:hypothetical protein